MRKISPRTPPKPTLAPADRQVRALSASLDRFGWECTQADIDLGARKARMCFRSYTGRLVTLDTDSLGRVTVTREQRASETALVGRRGDRMPVERLTTLFLGRSRPAGIRPGMREVANYIADNAGVARELVGAPIAALLGEAARDVTSVTHLATRGKP